MMIERIIEITAWVIVTGLLFWLIPRDKVREAFLIFFFKQLITWIFGLSIVEFGLVEYPVRLFSNATSTSFTFEYFVYPAICVLFNFYYPEGKHWFRQLGHYVLYVTGITILEVILERNTQLIKYLHWSWYWTWITLFATFFISRMYYKWFFRIGKKEKVETA